MGNSVTHFEINTENGAQSAEFYKSLFGWTVQNNPQMDYTHIDTGTPGTGINGGIAPSHGMPGTVVYVAVDDIQASLDKAVSLGATKIMGPDKVTDTLSIAIFRDPQGIVVGLSSGM